jgi:hypothetical protein
MLAAVGIAGLVVGGVGGYFFAKKKFKAKYEEMVTSEIAEAKEFYATLNKVHVDGAPMSPQEVLDRLHGEGSAEAALLEYQGRREEDDAEDEALLAKTESKVSRTPFGDAVVTTETEVTAVHPIGVDPGEGTTEQSNVFIDTTFDLEEESKYRTEDKPYIITHDEFYAAEKDYDTASFTYYEVDDVLCDERDKPVEETDEVVGDDHLVRFGSGSKDKNIVYVRNDRLGVEYEITRSPGSYLEEVLGMTDDEPGTLKHSNRESQQRRRREFRHGDG